jgi:hypothetical protein
MPNPYQQLKLRVERVTNLPDAYVGHMISGRLRVKIPSKKGDLPYLTSLKSSFSQLQGIEKLEVNPVTGSVLFIHNLDREQIAGYAHAKGIFSLERAKVYRPNLHKRVSQSIGYLDRWITSLTEGEMDLWAMSIVVLICAGIYEISRGNFTAIPWYAAFWYALSIFSIIKPNTA